MPTSLGALSSLDLTLIAAVVFLVLLSGGISLRLRTTPQAAQSDKDHSNKLNELQEKLEKAQAETKNGREEIELSLLQLHQVQEELEHYFLLSREQKVLLDDHADQQKRVRKLLSTLLNAQLTKHHLR